MSVIIERLMSREDVTVEVYSGYDGQGAQSFAAGVTIEAGAVSYTHLTLPTTPYV